MLSTHFKNFLNDYLRPQNQANILPLLAGLQFMKFEVLKKICMPKLKKYVFFSIFDRFISFFDIRIQRALTHYNTLCFVGMFAMKTHIILEFRKDKSKKLNLFLLLQLWIHLMSDQFSTALT